MGSALKPKSTRVRQTPSAKGDGAKRLSGQPSNPPAPRRPVRQRQAAARRNKPHRTSVTTQEGRRTLASIHAALNVARAATAVCSAVLLAQNADADSDTGRVLQRCVGDELDRQMERLETIIEGRDHE